MLFYMVCTENKNSIFPASGVLPVRTEKGKMEEKNESFTEQEVSSVVYDSRKVEEGSLFICIRGAVVDGHKFIPDVVAKGAKTLIVEEAVEVPEDVTVIQVEDTRYAMAFISAAWFGHPAEKLKTRHRNPIWYRNIFMIW